MWGKKSSKCSNSKSHLLCSMKVFFIYQKNLVLVLVSHSQCDLKRVAVTQTKPYFSLLEPISQQSPNSVEMCFLDENLEPSTGPRSEGFCKCIWWSCLAQPKAFFTAVPTMFPYQSLQFLFVLAVGLSPWTCWVVVWGQSPYRSPSTGSPLPRPSV